jgi:tetrahydromethanopterin S-methyltransferase subunit G
MDIGSFLIMLLSFTGAAVTVIWVIVLAIGRVKRMEASAGLASLTADELEDLRTRLSELEQRDVRMEELAERLDFVERVLGRSREGQQIGGPNDKQ